MMKRILTGILAVLMVLAMAACTAPEGDTPESTAVSTEAVQYAQQNYALHQVSDQLKLLGRSNVIKNGIACDLTASGIEFNAYIEESFTFTANCSASTYFTVFVDGIRVEQRFEAKGDFKDTQITVEDLGKLAMHNIRIVKQTEGNLSVATLKNLEFYGMLADAPEEQDLYIEFIGDSITCGYGNLWTTDSPDPSSKAGTAPYQDGTQSYAYLTAELLQADVSVVSCSGIGIDRSYTNQNGNGYTMADFYAMTSYPRSKTTEYDFAAARVPDLVVINLGTNDLSMNSTEKAFKDGVKELISFIRTSYGTDMPIVWAHDMMSEGRAQWVSSAIEELGGESADLYMVKLIRNKEGGNGHPSMEAQKTASQQLTEFIVNNGIV